MTVTAQSKPCTAPLPGASDSAQAAITELSNEAPGPANATSTTSRADARTAATELLLARSAACESAFTSSLRRLMRMLRRVAVPSKEMCTGSPSRHEAASAWPSLCSKITATAAAKR
jgi:hypothetical protein